MGMAQTTSVPLNEGTTYPSAGIGMNLNTQTSYDSYETQNLLLSLSASFQPPVNNISVQNTVTATTFTDFNPYSGIVANQYAGGTLIVRCNVGSTVPVQSCSGGNYGNSYTIASNTASNGTIGAVFTLSGGAVTHPQYETATVIGPTITSLSTDDIFGWVAGSSGTGSVSIDTTGGDQISDAAQSTTQVIKLSIGASTGTANIHGSFNNTSFNNIAFSGTYTGGIQIKVLSGSGGTVTMSVVATGVSQNFTFSPSGSGYSTYSSTASISATNPQTITVTYTLSGCTNCSVAIAAPELLEPKTNASSTMRDQVYTDLITTEKIGEFRFSWPSNGDSLLNCLATQKTRRGQSPNGNAYEYGPSLGCHDTLAAYAAWGVKQAEIAIPLTWTTTDITNFTDYLCATTGTYATLRTNLGQATPWCQVYNRILLEYGNEVWNPGSGNVYLPSYVISGNGYWNYVPMAILMAQAAKGDSNWNSSVMKFVVGVQSGSSGPFQVGLFESSDTSHYIDIVTANEYQQLNTSSCTAPNLFQSASTEPWQNVFDSSSASGYYQTWAQANGTYGFETYEYQNGTGGGSCTQAQLTGFPEGMGYALVDALSMALANKQFGVTDMDFFTALSELLSPAWTWLFNCRLGFLYRTWRIL